MKKAKLLTPILAIAGLGATVTPLVTMTSCGNKKTEEQKVDGELAPYKNLFYSLLDEEGEYVLFTFKPGQTYTFKNKIAKDPDGNVMTIGALSISDTGGQFQPFEKLAGSSANLLPFAWDPVAKKWAAPTASHITTLGEEVVLKLKYTGTEELQCLITMTAQ